jgi:hypothetical protein
VVNDLTLSSPFLAISRITVLHVHFAYSALLLSFFLLPCVSSHLLHAFFLSVLFFLSAIFSNWICTACLHLSLGLLYEQNNGTVIKYFLNPKFDRVDEITEAALGKKEQQCITYNSCQTVLHVCCIAFLNISHQEVYFHTLHL